MNATNRWQLQEAKNRLSEVVRRARAEGPQIITLRGDDAVVVVSAIEYQKLGRSPNGSLVEFFRNSPLRNAELNLKRSRDTGRKVDL